MSTELPIPLAAPKSPPVPALPPPKSERLTSLDALRGFDMFWIIGGDILFKTLVHREYWPKFVQNAYDAFRAHVPLGGWSLRHTVTEQLSHAEWEGFRFYDLIFPLFLFMAGVALPFSLGKLRERGEPLSHLYLRVLRRGIVLFILALIYNRLLQFTWLRFEWADSGALNVGMVPDQIRWVGVLQRIAICSMLAGFIYLMFPRPRGQFLTLAAILVGYWAILAFVPTPAEGDAAQAEKAAPEKETAADSKKPTTPLDEAIDKAFPERKMPPEFSKEGNLSGYIDRKVLSKTGFLQGRILRPYYGHGDNEGILSTLPAIGTALMGVLAAQWIRGSGTPLLKVGGLLGGGLVSLFAGWLWGFWLPVAQNLGKLDPSTVANLDRFCFPIIKNLWTSTFVLWSGGWCLILLALFYLVIEIWRLKAWAFPFVVIGMNSITIYMAQVIIPFGTIAEFFVGKAAIGGAAATGLVRLVGPSGRILSPLSTLICKWLFLLVLYKKKIFLRV